MNIISFIKSKSMTTKVVVMALVLIAITEFCLSWDLVGFSHALTYAANDPGKTIFHLILLPFAFVEFTRSLPDFKVIYHALSENRKIQLKWIVGILAVLAIALIANEIDSHCNLHKNQKDQTYIMPHDIKDSITRTEIIVLRDKIFDSTTSNADSMKIVRMKTEYLNKVKSVCCGFPAYMTPFMSFNYLESAIGTVFGGLILFLMMTSVIAYWDLHNAPQFKVPLNNIINSYSKIGLLMIAEVILRTYSDNYINFLHPGQRNLDVFFILLAVLIFVTIFATKNISKKQTNILSVIYAAIAGILAFGESIFKLPVHEWMGWFYEWNLLPRIIIYLFLILLVVFFSIAGRNQSQGDNGVG
ncbi:hypothetical protein [Puia dinghuensis]|uniref:hypothetical protein n=1 Tax=Puia dinghuensis TaxID=1792502 RepID=UPI001E51B3A5|nr:hypothetical protein [Puia dinghuensis]